MVIGGVLDPCLKMKVVEITFPHMFPSNLVTENINKVRNTLYEFYDEYKVLYPLLVEELGESRNIAPHIVKGEPSGNAKGFIVRCGERVEPRKS